jgi:hypothetical protein
MLEATTIEWRIPGPYMQLSPCFYISLSLPFFILFYFIFIISFVFCYLFIGTEKGGGTNTEG